MTPITLALEVSVKVRPPQSRSLRPALGARCRRLAARIIGHVGLWMDAIGVARPLTFGKIIIHRWAARAALRIRSV